MATEEDLPVVLPPTYTRQKVYRWPSGETVDDAIADEVPISITYNGISHVVMMASPELLEEFAAPFTPPAPQVGDAAARAIRAVCIFLEEHYAERISLDDLGRLAGLDKYYLLRAFTRAKGITPYRYLENVRIARAKALLETGVTPVEAALSAGFADQSHFTKFFKCFIGLTPKQYQRIFIPAKR